MNLNDTVKNVEARMTKIEQTLDQIAHNHLAHVEKYTKWTLVGIVVSISLSVAVMFLTL
jgi:hypothetical protein